MENVEIKQDNNTTLLNDERQLCERWTRVMGYYRPVSQFNIGKKGEFAERLFFQECKKTDKEYN